MAEGDPAAYADINVPGLRDALAKLGLPTTGKRSELIARLELAANPKPAVARCTSSRHRIGRRARRHRRGTSAA